MTDQFPGLPKRYAARLVAAGVDSIQALSALIGDSPRAPTALREITGLGAIGSNAVFNWEMIRRHRLQSAHTAPPDGWYWLRHDLSGEMEVVWVEGGGINRAGMEGEFRLLGWPDCGRAAIFGVQFLGPVTPYEPREPDEAAMFRWLLAADPRTLTAIAWRVPEACAYSDPVEAIRAAMKATPAPSPTPQAPPASTS